MKTNKQPTIYQFLLYYPLKQGLKLDNAIDYR